MRRAPPDGQLRSTTAPLREQPARRTPVRRLRAPQRCARRQDDCRESRAPPQCGVLNPVRQLERDSGVAVRLKAAAEVVRHQPRRSGFPSPNALVRTDLTLQHSCQIDQGWWDYRGPMGLPAHGRENETRAGSVEHCSCDTREESVEIFAPVRKDSHWIAPATGQRSRRRATARKPRIRVAVRHIWLIAATNAALPSATEKPLTATFLTYLATLTPIRITATPKSQVPGGTSAAGRNQVAPVSMRRPPTDVVESALQRRVRKESFCVGLHGDPSSRGSGGAGKIRRPHGMFRAIGAATHRIPRLAETCRAN